jgi:hypothetical protein
MTSLKLLETSKADMVALVRNKLRPEVPSPHLACLLQFKNESFA